MKVAAVTMAYNEPEYLPIWTEFQEVQKTTRSARAFFPSFAPVYWYGTGAVLHCDIDEILIPHDLIDTYLRDVEHLRSNHMSDNVSIEIQEKQTYIKAVAAKELDGTRLIVRGAVGGQKKCCKGRHKQWRQRKFVVLRRIIS